MQIYSKHLLRLFMKKINPILTHAPIALLMLLLSSIVPVNAQEMETPVQIQIPLFLKILSFDRNLKTRSKDVVHVGILFQKNVRQSVQVKNDVLKTVEEMQQKEILGMPTQFIPVEFTSESDLASAATRYNLEVIYITPMRAVDISALSAHCHEHHMLSMTGVVEYMETGIAVGIGLKGEKPLIIINPTAAKNAGADFHSQLLKLAKIIQ